MRPTRPPVLVALVVGTALVVYAGLGLLRPLLPALPWSLPVALAVVAAGIVVTARSLRRRLDGDPGARPVDPIGTARMAALAKACSHAGAVVAGGYVGVAVHLLVTTDSGARRYDALMAVATVVAAGLLVAAGLFLERVCRVDSDDAAPPPAATG